ncbi:MAG: hypothetical protein ACXWPM_06645 [Bdellovibrionota bacterium]
MKKTLGILVLNLLVSAMPLAHADQGTMEMSKYLTISESKTVELPASLNMSLRQDLQLLDGATPPATGAGDAVGGDWTGSFDAANVIIDQIINMGKKIWDIVAANKPVVNVQTNVASALPQGADSWTNLQGWQNPVARTFQTTYKNIYGMKVVDFTYRLLYTYGGNVNGQGRFLAAVTVIPANLTVAWGYTFNASTAVPTVVNAGTKVDPVAQMQVQIKWSVDTVLNHAETTQAYSVRGDGEFADLNQ